MKPLASLCEIWLSKNLQIIDSAESKNDLPIELRDRILSHLDFTGDNLQYYLTPNRAQLSLKSLYWLNDTHFYSIAQRCPNLQKIELDGKITDVAIAQIAKCTNLVSLQIESSAITDNSIHYLIANGCTNLRELKIISSLLSPTILSQFFHFENLASLHLPYCVNLDRNHFQSMSHLSDGLPPHLSELNISGWTAITMDSLKHVLIGRQWTKLIFRECSKLKGFDSLQFELSSLVYIDLSIRCLNDSEIATVAKYAKDTLRSVHLANIGNSITNVLQCRNLEQFEADKFENSTKKDISIPELECMQAIVFGECDVIMSDLLHNIIVSCPNLSSLILMKSSLRDDGLIDISQSIFSENSRNINVFVECRRLETLLMYSDLSITEKSMKSVYKNLQSLQRVYLNQKVANLEGIENCQSLKYFNSESNKNINDNDLKMLAKCKMLEEIRVFSPNVMLGGVLELLEELPLLKKLACGFPVPNADKYPDVKIQVFEEE